MKKIKQVLSIVLALIMVVSIIPMSTITASATETSGTCGENVNWEFDSETGTLTISGTGAMTDFVVKASSWPHQNNRPWEDYKNSISSVIIQEGVTNIGEYAFYDLPKLKNVSISDSVTKISFWAFRECVSLESIIIPDSVTTIDTSAFYDCTGLTKVILSNNLTTIGGHIFSGCASLKDITIPDSVETISQYAFYGCESLTSVRIPDNVTTIGEFAFAECTNLINVITGNSVTTLDKYAFYGCSKLESIVISKSIATIGESAFGGCDCLTGITVDKDNQYFSSDEYGVLFDKEKITLLQYPNGNPRTNYEVPGSVTTIERQAFWDSKNLTTVVLPDSVTSIGIGAFRGCSGLISIIIPDGVTTISDSMFFYCSNLTDITLPDSVTEIGISAFAKCEGLTNFVLPDSVKIINTHAFNFCYNLESITIPEGVTSIGNSAFAKCESLTSITIPDSVISIGSALFEGCTSLKNVTLPKKMTAISSHLFSGCTNLESVVIPDTVTSIEYAAFEDCTSLKEIIIPNSVTSIADDAFSGCSSIECVILPDGITEIDWYVFRNCTSLKNITIPDSVTKVGRLSFYNCVNLTDVYFCGTEEQWKEIEIDIANNGNDPLLNATIHYNYVDPNKFTGIKDNHFYKNDVMQKAYQLVEFDGDFYYIADRHEIVKDKKVYIKAERVEGFTYPDGTPLTAGYYEFDENGKMIILDGIVGNKVYKNNVQLKAYQLVEIDGDLYYVADRHEIVKDKKVYIKAERVEGFTYPDGTPLTEGYYEFDENGKMIILDGIVGNKVYKNNVQLKAYQLVEIDGDLYYVADRHEIVKDKKVYIKAERVEGFTYPDGTPLEAGYYEFDENGKMIILNGIVGNNIYKNNTKLKAYQLVEIDGDFYFIGDRHEIVKDKKIYLNEERINGLTYADGTPIATGYHNVDADGKLIRE